MATGLTPVYTQNLDQSQISAGELTAESNVRTVLAKRI